MVTKTKKQEQQKQEQEPIDFVKFYDNGQELTAEISGEMGIRKASRNGKFIAIEGPERTLIIGMSRKNPQNPWAGFTDTQPAKESDFINLDMAFGVALSGTYVVSKSWNNTMQKGWIIIKSIDYDTTGEGYKISTVEDQGELRLSLRRLTENRKDIKQDKSVEM